MLDTYEPEPIGTTGGDSGCGTSGPGGIDVVGPTVFFNQGLQFSDSMLLQNLARFHPPIQ